jgi:DNA-directed RNA polymerase subunit RPC12/RpoP
MDNFIAMVCPSCGGKIEVEKDLEKMFCSHCGTQLLLRQGADGLLMPMKARDLNASAQLKETQSTLMVSDVLKTRIRELEEQVAGIRKAFFMDYMQRQKSGRAKPARQLIDAYAKSIGFTGKYPRKGPLGGDPATGHTKFGDTAFWNAMLVVNTPGFNTAGDMFRFHQFITRPENDDRDARQVAQTISAIVQVWPELKEKTEKLKKAMDNIV